MLMFNTKGKATYLVYRNTKKSRSNCKLDFFAKSDALDMAVSLKEALLVWWKGASENLFTK